MSLFVIMHLIVHIKSCWHIQWCAMIVVEILSNDHIVKRTRYVVCVCNLNRNGQNKYNIKRIF